MPAIPEDDKTEAYQRLRRLQEHSRSDIPAMMAHRAMSSFTLQEEPAPKEANEQILVVIYPQDPFVSSPEVRLMNAGDIRPGLSNTRVRIQDSRGGSIAEPDADGNYMFWPDDPRFDQVNAFYYVTLTLRMYERYARRTLPWSFPTPRLTVEVAAGDGGNAFYNEQDQQVGFQSFRLNGDLHSTAHSADIISHEAAHAILDGVRDLHNESFGLGPMAFHESFGDITAMLIALHDDSLVKRVLDWTNNDLRLTNFVTEVAEHLTGVLMGTGEGYRRGNTIYLRNAINDLRAMPFDRLDYSPADPEFTLGRQSHNYSRLFSGAFYDIFAGIYEHCKAKTPPHIAIYRARDAVGHLLMSAIELGPVGEFDFSDMARAFVTADHVVYDGQYRSILMSVFNERGLLEKAEVDEYVTALNALPDVRLPGTLNSALASALFLEGEVLPKLDLGEDLDLIPVATYRNSAGYAYLTYFSSHRISITGEQYQQFDGANVDLFGGLTLMFDPDNRLRSAVYRPVNDEDIRQTLKITEDLIRENLVVDHLRPDIQRMRYQMPEGLYLGNGFGQKGQPQSRLVRMPILWDPIPNQVRDFADYIRQLNVHVHKK